MKTRHIIKLSLILAGTYNLLLAVQSVAIFISSLLQYGWSPISSTTLASSLYIIVICFFLIFRSDTVIQLMRLENGFKESEIRFDMSQFETLLKIVVVLVGLWAIASSFPSLLAELIYVIREENIADAALNHQNAYRWILESIFRLIFGFLLLFNYNRISRWITGQNSLEQ